MERQKVVLAKADAPSNIAIVKYWGKQAIQEPVNPSISFTLSRARTETKVSYTAVRKELKIDFLFEGKRKKAFIPKLEKLIQALLPRMPFLQSGELFIESSNTFPHSSGIASSASAMAALVKGLYSIHQQLSQDDDSKMDAQKISAMARLGSGSACRSTLPGWVLWGETAEYASSSNLYGCSINELVHPLFLQLQDSILLIRSGAKSVSSSAGHALMKDHPYRQGRIQQANKHTAELLRALKMGDFTAFAGICEAEALSLHGLMMSSSPPYTLMAPESLAAIETIRSFRLQHNIPLTFTLDAGPNIHLIYPNEVKQEVLPFIEDCLKPLCENKTVIYDELSIQ
ncbi:MULTISPECIES: diphosphomevalonate decarboxylase [unclassified Carboxylicivirga]|uniref:diphosphomevalonate decarboxylase n=1 Tax=Carboxylicivirga TaxID=1628153 RepID=UPI003D358582